MTLHTWAAAATPIAARRSMLAPVKYSLKLIVSHCHLLWSSPTWRLSRCPWPRGGGGPPRGPGRRPRGGAPPWSRARPPAGSRSPCAASMRSCDYFVLTENVYLVLAPVGGHGLCVDDGDGHGEDAQHHQHRLPEPQHQPGAWHLTLYKYSRVSRKHGWPRTRHTN